MKFYLVVRLAKDIRSQKSVELPVIFTRRADAEETCGALNMTKGKDDPGFIVEEREEPGEEPCPTHRNNS